MRNFRTVSSMNLSLEYFLREPTLDFCHSTFLCLLVCFMFVFAGPDFFPVAIASRGGDELRFVAHWHSLDYETNHQCAFSPIGSATQSRVTTLDQARCTASSRSNPSWLQYFAR
jgi:hypothetical protein